MQIYLCGFMGSGKSTWRQIWARDLEAGEVSLDFDQKLLQDSPHPGLSTWVQREGWSAFRRRERELLKETLAHARPGLFALGGGALEEGGLPLLRSHSHAQLVWINCPVDICWQRSHGPSQLGQRPLANGGRAAFEKLYRSRLGHYRRADLALSPEQCRQITWRQIKEKLTPPKVRPPAK